MNQNKMIIAVLPNAVLLGLLLSSLTIGVYSYDFAVVSNCYESKEIAEEYKWTPYTVAGFIPRWRDNGTNVLNYKWSFSMTNITVLDGKEVNKVVDISHWMRPWNDTFVLWLPKYALPPGWYMVQVGGTLKPDSPHVGQTPVKPFSSSKKKCFLHVEAMPPVVVISGGHSRITSDYSDIFISGGQSYDRNFKEVKRDGLEFEWSCTQKLQPPTFCTKDPISTSAEFAIPARFVKDGDVFEVTLVVKASFGSRANQTQRIEVLGDVAVLEVGCRKNCPPVTPLSNYELVTIVAVSCTKNCHQVQEEDYKWTIQPELSDEEFIFDYEKDTRHGRIGHKFMINEKALTPGVYTVTVDMKNELGVGGQASIRIEYARPPIVSDCKITPGKGDTFNTMYIMGCTQKPPEEKYFYELYAKEPDDFTDGELIADGFYPHVFNEPFVLPPSQGKIFRVKVFKKYCPYLELPVDVQVESAIAEQSGDKVVEILKGVYHGQTPQKSIVNLVASKDPQTRNLAIQLFQSMVNELIVSKIQNEEFADFVEDLKYLAAQDMMKAPLTSVNEILKLSDSLTRLAAHNEPPESDPLLAKFTTSVCRKMVDKYLDLMRQERYPLNLAHKSQKMSSTMRRCLDTHSNPNYAVLAPIVLNLTTTAPRSDVPMITENYANYVDFEEEYYKNLDYLKESTFNIINASSKAAKVIAMTTAVGEDPIETFGKAGSTLVVKDVGDYLARSRFRTKGVVLVPSQDFADQLHSYDILITTWSKDILWWNSAHTQVATDMVNFEFWHSTCKERIINFDKPAKLLYEMKNNSDFASHRFEDVFVVPEGYTTMGGDELNYRIKVRRIALPKGRTLHVKFYNISEVEAFDVVLTVFKFPTIEDFVNSTKISPGQDSLVFVSQYDYDIFCYVGILASNETVLPPVNISFEMSFTVTNCIRWSASEMQWKVACKPGLENSETVISCECRRFSVIAGYQQNIRSLPQEVEPPGLQLELHSCKIIFITVATTFGIFCLLFVLVLVQKKNEIYYLGDNKSTDRFAYLVIVRTGMKRNSGTSSNVLIKLVGDRNSTDAHLLNYPDPKKRILQRFGHDSFLLTSEHHLGTLEYVELWFDSIGINPDWYCKDIVIYDMQQHTEWYFNVKKRLTLNKNINKIVVYPSGATQASGHKKRRCRCKLTNRYHTWYLWQKEENFSYSKKLTVILSTVLMTYAVALVFLEVPTFHLKDGFDKFQYNATPYMVFVAFASSFPAFMLHIAIAWSFRFSQIQYSRYEQKDKLSFRVTAACWLLLIIVSVVSTSFLIVFGFWVPYNSSLIWLSSCGIGIGFGVFIYESIFVFLQNFICRFQLVHNVGRKFYDIWAAVENQRFRLHNQFGEALLRPYFGHLYEPLDRKEIKEKVLVLRQRKHIIAELEDLVMFSIYIVILYVVILAHKDSLVARGETEMVEMLKGVHVNHVTFPSISTVNGIYEYVNFTLIPSLQSPIWYGNYQISDPGLMKDMTNKYIGVARLRQHRILPELCKVPEIMRFLNVSCWSDFSLSHAETKTFGYAWGEVTSHMALDRLKSIWRYTSPLKTETLGTFGELSAYSGGGYVVYLGRTLYNSYANFRKIVKKMWIDQKTRAIFIEFLAYNANYNVFNSVRILFEKSATGYVDKRIEVTSARMLYVENEVEEISVVSFLLFVAWVAMLFFKQSVGLIKNIHTFYKNVWLMVDIFIILMSISCIALFMIRMQLVGRYLRVLETMKRNEFLNYFHLFYIEDVLTFCAAVLVCIATVRLWKFLRFGMMFRVLERTLSIAAVPLAATFLYFMVLLVAFSLTLLTMFGNYFEHMYSLTTLMRLMVTITLTPDGMALNNFLTYKLAVFYLTLYILIINTFVVIFIIIVVGSYMQAQLEFSAVVETYSIKTYVQERIRYIPRYLRYKYGRLKAGQEEQNRVYPKSDKFLYLNSVSIAASKMRIMAEVTRCVIRRKKGTRRSGFLSDHDARLMMGVCRVFMKKSEDNQEVEVVYKEHGGGFRIKFVHENKLEKIANVVNLLLKEKPAVAFGEERGNVVTKQCVEKIKKNQETLRKCNLMLKLILHKMQSVELEFRDMIV